MNKKFLYAQSFMNDSFKLAEKIHNSGYIPDVVIGIWRGGSITAMVIHEYLNFMGEDDKLILDKNVWNDVENILSNKKPKLLITAVIPFSNIYPKKFNKRNLEPKFPPNLPLYHQGIIYSKYIFYLHITHKLR